MAVMNENITNQISHLNEYSEISLVCPVCKTRKRLKFPKAIINETGQITTISIQKALVCQHHFQAFVDNNFKIRGYQKVDFEFASNLVQGENEDIYTNRGNSDQSLFEHLIIEGNYVEYSPKNASISKNSKTEPDLNEITNKTLNNDKEHDSEIGKLMLEDIYNEFWEFINEHNETFREFIRKDSRRNEDLIIFNN